MSVTVTIPTPLRSFTGGRDAVELQGATVGEVIDGLLSTHGGLKRHLVQDDGRRLTGAAGMVVGVTLLALA